MNKIHFAKAVPAPKLTWPSWWWLPMFLGALSTCMALTQLASFEAFVLVLESYGWTDGPGTFIFAVTLASLEILSLPVLFQLAMSKAMRGLSAFAAVMTPFLWVILLYSGLLGTQASQESGVFGGLIDEPVSWLLLIEMKMVFVLSILALYILGYFTSVKR